VTLLRTFAQCSNDRKSGRLQWEQKPTSRVEGVKSLGGAVLDKKYWESNALAQNLRRIEAPSIVGDIVKGVL